MAQARLRISKGNKEAKYAKLSIQHALDCSFYNQGCDGGYPYLINKFAHDLHLVDESCKAYSGLSQLKCNTLRCNPLA
jgi:cathepsin C